MDNGLRNTDFSWLDYQYYSRENLQDFTFYYLERALQTSFRKGEGSAAETSLQWATHDLAIQDIHCGIPHFRIGIGFAATHRYPYRTFPVDCLGGDL